MYQGPMKIKDAKVITDSLTRTSKMPGFSYSLPAWACKTGQKLAKIPGTPCYGCYAMKGNYARYPAIKRAQYRRLDAINHPLWVKAMAAQIISKKSKYFRWHDAGDLQSVKHLLKIFKVCKLTPEVKHWIPTQERQFINKIPIDRIPKNLVIRLSGSKVDGPIPKSWPWTSTVTSKHNQDNCPAFRTDKTGTVHTLQAFDTMTKENKKDLDLGHCGDCRKCWSRSIKNISYGKH